MGVRQISTAAPTAAARARSILATAWSCEVTTDIGREDLVGSHGVTDEGEVRIQPPADSLLSAAVLCAPHGEPTVLIEFADAAPVPVRDRIRARLWLSGSLEPDGEQFVLRPIRAVLQQDLARNPGRSRPGGSASLDCSDSEVPTGPHG